MPNLNSSSRLQVRGPRCINPIRFGLLSVVEPVTPSDMHWEGVGVEWEDYLCGPQVESFLDFCPPATGYTKTGESDINYCLADPFYVKGSYECSPVGRPVNEAFEIARQRLLNWENYEVERIFWSGDSANGDVNPNLVTGNTTCGIEPIDLTPGAGAVDPVGAIAVLEEALSDISTCGGVIHAAYGIGAYLAHLNLMERDGDRYFTPTGQALALGAGYGGTGPGDIVPDAGDTWMYATGPISIWRSNVFMTPDEVDEGVNRNINNITVHAERVYAVGFSCGLFAVRTALTCSC